MQEVEKKQMPWEETLPGPLAAPAGEAAAEAPLECDAFAGFYERSARQLWAYLARVSGDTALADDLMQESYLRFLCAAGQPTLAEGEVAARRYLFRIGSNLLRDAWRRPRTESLEEMQENRFAVDTGTASADSRMLLGPALEQMRPRDRQMLWLAYAEGYSHREIAEVTGLAAASVRLLLFRARRRMVKLLENDMPRRTK